MTSDDRPHGAGVVIKYNDDVKALLRASGMTDEDIAKSEDMATAASNNRPQSPKSYSENMMNKFASSPLEPMGSRRID